MIGRLTTQIVGSYAKPHWLAHHARMRALDGSWWRPEGSVLEEAKRDAARLAIYEQERAGLDVVTDGEAQRPAYDRHFLQGLEGIDMDARLEVDIARPVEGDGEFLAEFRAHGSTGPAVIAPLRHARPVAVEELRFARATARKPVKICVIGPLTLARSLHDRFYGDDQALVLALAEALNAELRALEEAGADYLQIDEPSLHMRLPQAERFGVEAVARMTHGLTRPVIMHLCYGYALVNPEKSPSEDYAKALRLAAACPVQAISLEYEQPGHEPEILAHCGEKKSILLGLLDMSLPEAETVEHIATRLRAALRVVPAHRLHAASDCGMWYLPRPLAYAKISALAQAALRVRQTLPTEGYVR
jgi:5-methyltetrahydropteroyltriglutamate--homocysteine methyltransferase